MCAETEEEAIRRGLEGANFFGYSLLHYALFADRDHGRGNLWEEFLKNRDAMGFSVDTAATQADSLEAKVADRQGGDASGLRGAVGTPDQIREFLLRYEEVGVDQVIFVYQAGNNRHEDIMDALELFGTKVLPEFAERDEAASAAKATRMEAIIEQVMARRG
jgi:alkanesulfonate monooxygenase SsuD/methylene tetrahydromethanopterin reductase-like flavin-dependent oxidoreductase (luciferase family)